MRIRFIATDKTKEFHKGEELEGFYSPSPTRKPLICITKNGEEHMPILRNGLKS